MIPTLPVISKSSEPCTNPLVTVPKALITIGITVTFMFQSFYNFPGKIRVLILLFAFLQFYSMVSKDSKVLNLAISPFLLIIIKSRRLDQD